MTNQHDTQSPAKPATAKRASRTRPLLIAVASLALSAVALPAAAANWWNANPIRTTGDLCGYSPP